MICCSIKKKQLTSQGITFYFLQHLFSSHLLLVRGKDDEIIFAPREQQTSLSHPACCLLLSHASPALYLALNLHFIPSVSFLLLKGQERNLQVLHTVWCSWFLEHTSRVTSRKWWDMSDILGRLCSSLSNLCLRKLAFVCYQQVLISICDTSYILICE